MGRLRMNVVVDVAAFAAVVLLAATGCLMRYVLPPGSGHFSTLWAMDRHDWGRIHFWIAAVLVGVIVLHILLHWSWIVCVVKGRSAEGVRLRAALAIVGLLVLAGLAMAPFLGQVEQGGEPPHKGRSATAPTSPAFQIDGAMTLREVEQHTGVPASVILEELGLPLDLTTDERLGRLRKQYDFQMHDVRRIVEQYREQRGTKGHP